MCAVLGVYVSVHACRCMYDYMRFIVCSTDISISFSPVMFLSPY